MSHCHGFGCITHLVLQPAPEPQPAVSSDPVLTSKNSQLSLIGGSALGPLIKPAPVCFCTGSQAIQDSEAPVTCTKPRACFDDATCRWG
ncbi:unnamed protein product [Protopolystoma xenopodis]|uniref:Uncharacterized protein n=1 Tax=Protopolystoma xenopodis TaxID=117903 RepID=A0A3S5CBQ0_9PLAT|nr:unnamed protein product [Protopolystoma xenopodis]